MLRYFVPADFVIDGLLFVYPFLQYFYWYLFIYFSILF